MKRNIWSRTRLAAVVMVIVAGVAGAASAAPPPPVFEYTGCLKTNGTSNGTVYALREGSTPLSPCKAPDKELHLSGGDITDVLAGTGLTGGGSNGAVTLGLAAGYQLPQGCADGKVAKSSSGIWVCAVDIDTDTNTTYSPGTGLDLSGTTFSVRPPYQLPQGCANGQVPKSSTGLWVCATDIDTDTDTTYAAGTGLDLSGNSFGINGPYRLPQGCAPGQVAKVVAGGTWVCATDIDTDTDTDTTYGAGTGLVLDRDHNFSLADNQQLPTNCGLLEVPRWALGGGWFCDSTGLPISCHPNHELLLWVNNSWQCGRTFPSFSTDADPGTIHELAPGARATFSESCGGGNVTGGGYHVLGNVPADVRILGSYAASLSIGPSWSVDVINEDTVPALIAVHAVCMSLTTAHG